MVGSEIDFDSSLEDLSNTTVETASRSAEIVAMSPGVTTVITQEHIKVWGAVNIADVLSRVAGTQAYLNPGLMRIGLRGNEPLLSPHNVLFLINGKPVRVDNGNLALHAVYYTFPLKHIERIEIMRGPGSVLYGTNAVDGVVNIITRASHVGKTHIDVLQGDYNSTLFEVSSLRANEESDVAFGARYFTSKRPPLTSGRNSAPDSTFRLRVPETSLSFFGRGASGNVSFQAFFSDNEVGLIDRVPSMEPTNAQIDFVSRVWHVGAQWEDRVADDMLLNINYVFNFEEFEFELGNARALYWETQLQSVETTLDIDLGSSSRLFSGIAIDYSEGLTSSSTPLFDELSYRAFAQADYFFASDIKATFGIQAYADEFTSLHLIPRLAVNASFDSFYAKVLYGLGYRAPLPGERYLDNPPFQIGKRDLEPEKASTLSTQLGYSGSWFYASATAFYTEKREGIVYSTSIDTNYNISLSNAGNTSSAGVEFEYRAWIEPFVIDCSVTWYQHTNGDTLDNYTLTPSVTGKLGISVDIAEFHAGFFVSAWTTPHDVAIRNTQVVDLNPDPEAAVVADLNVQYHIQGVLGIDTDKTIWVRLYVDNVLDAEVYFPDLLYFNRNSIPAEFGRTVYVGVGAEI